MKHLKLFEDINFDEWDEEEFDNNINWDIVHQKIIELNNIEVRTLIFLVNKLSYYKLKEIVELYNISISNLEKRLNNDNKIYIYLHHYDHYGSYMNYKGGKEYNKRMYPKVKIIDLT